MQLEPRLASPARRLFLGAKIICNSRCSVFDCVVRTLSKDGATLRMNSTLGVPGTFQLHIKPAGETFDCAIAWRTETDIGVTFEGLSDVAGSQLLNGLQLAGNPQH